MRLVVDRLTFGYSADPLLDDVSLLVQGGQSLAVVGPSGSGKSTLLGLLGSVLKPAGGEIRIEHAGSATPSDSAPRVSWIFQTNVVLPHRTVRDNVRLGLSAEGLGGKTAQRRSDAALAAVGLRGMGGRKAGSLSGGEVQRVTIARAKATQPDLILADEPTGQLDAATSEQVADYLLATTDLGGIVVLATHDLGLAHRCSLVLDLGSLR